MTRDRFVTKVSSGKHVGVEALKAHVGVDDVVPHKDHVCEGEALRAHVGVDANALHGDHVSVEALGAHVGVSVPEGDYVGWCS